MAGFPPKAPPPIAPNADHKTPQPKGASAKKTPVNPAQAAHSTGYTPKKGPPAQPLTQMPQGSMVPKPSMAQLGAMRAQLKQHKAGPFKR